MAVQFHFQADIRLEERTRLKAFLADLCKSEGRKLGELNIIFVSDKALLEINKNYLQHDFYTDIITFDLGDGKGNPVMGEIYISTDRVRENAGSFRKSIRNELHRVIFHGLLHLCGYTDKSSIQQQRMRNREDHYLSLYFGK